VAAECDEADGMHWLGQAAFLAEFIDPTTERVVAAEDGVTAELVITTIKREAHPLMRFRTHDLVRLTTSPCPCGRTSVRFHVLGRGDDMLIVRGINLFPLAIASVVDEFRPEASGEFRIMVDQPPPLTDPPRLLVEAAPDLPSERWQPLAVDLADRIRTVHMVALRVEGAAPGTYPRSEAKTKHVVHAWRGERTT